MAELLLLWEAGDNKFCLAVVKDESALWHVLSSHDFDSLLREGSARSEYRCQCYLVDERFRAHDVGNQMRIESISNAKGIVANATCGI